MDKVIRVLERRAANGDTEAGARLHRLKQKTKIKCDCYDGANDEPWYVQMGRGHSPDCPINLDVKLA